MPYLDQTQEVMKPVPDSRFDGNGPVGLDGLDRVISRNDQTHGMIRSWSEGHSGEVCRVFVNRPGIDKIRGELLCLD